VKAVIIFNTWPEEYKGKPVNATNETGFSAVQAGMYSHDEFSHEGYTGWWTSSAVDSNAWIRRIAFSTIPSDMSSIAKSLPFLSGA